MLTIKSVDFNEEYADCISAEVSPTPQTSVLDIKLNNLVRLHFYRSQVHLRLEW